LDITLKFKRTWFSHDLPTRLQRFASYRINIRLLALHRTAFEYGGARDERIRAGATSCLATVADAPP
jgi:hypothetical protein